MEVNDKVLFEVVAAEIIDRLDPEQKASILRKGVADALNGYDFRRAVEKRIVERAEARVTTVVEFGRFDAMIDAAIESEFAWIRGAMPGAIRAAMLEVFGGKRHDSAYQQAPGLLLKHLEAARPKSEAG